MNEQRHRPWLPTVILVGIVVLLVLFVIFVLPNLEPPPEPDVQPTLALLWPFDSEDLVSISITKGFQTTTVERSGMAWRVVAPTPGDGTIRNESGGRASPRRRSSCGRRWPTRNLGGIGGSSSFSPSFCRGSALRPTPRG